MASLSMEADACLGGNATIESPLLLSDMGDAVLGLVRLCTYYHNSRL